MTDRAFAFLAAAPDSGKTTLAIGLARYLSNEGVRAVPFKAVTVVHETDDVAFTGVDPTRWGVMHNAAAARARFEVWQNPVTVVLDHRDGDRGELFTLGRPGGRVPVAGRDRVDIADMSSTQEAACREAVHTALEIACREEGILVVEGAGDAGALPASRDLSNMLAPSAVDAAVFFVCNVNRSRSSAVVGQLARRCRAESLDVRGLVFNQVADGPLPIPPAGLDLLACVAVTPDLDDYDASPEQLQFLYERSAAAVARSGLTEHLLGLPR